MKQLLFISFFISMSCQLVAQTYFNKTYDNANALDVGGNIVVTDNENYIMAGRSVIGSTKYLYLLEIDQTGDTLWTKLIGDNSDEYYVGDIELFNNYLYCVGGYKNTTTMDTSKAFLIKSTLTGDTLWKKLYGSQYSHFNALAIEDDGDIVMTGWYQDVQPGNSKSYVVKVDSLGDVEWENMYGGAGDETILSIDISSDNKYLLGGYTTAKGQGGSDIYVIQLDTIGVMLWDTTFGGINNDGGTAFILQDGNYLIQGGSTDDILDKQAFLTKFDPTTKQVIWERTFGDDLYNTFQSTGIELDNGELVFIGFSESQINNQPEGWLMKTSVTGDSLWSRTFKIRENDHYFTDIKPTSDGGFVIGGYVFPDGTGNTQDMWLVKVDSMGCDVAKCVTGINENLKVESGNLKLYPNPATDELTVETQLATYNNAYIEIYDLQGKLVYRKTITQTVSMLDISNLYKGVYVCKLLADGELFTTERIIKL